MPTIVGILTFISMINTISERLKARNFFICQYCSFNEQLKFFRAQLSCAWKSFITSGPGLVLSCWVIFHAFVVVYRFFFFKTYFFRKFFRELYQCQTAWNKIRTDVLSVMICVQTVCLGYQQITNVAESKAIVADCIY